MRTMTTSFLISTLHLLVQVARLYYQLKNQPLFHPQTREDNSNSNSSNSHCPFLSIYHGSSGVLNALFTVLVHLDCCNRIPRTGRLINKGNLLLIVLEVGSPRSRHWEISVNPLPSTLMSHCILTWQKWGGSSLGSLL